MDEFIRVLQEHTKDEEKRFEAIDRKISHHVENDYPKVIQMLESHEHILHEINGGMKVLKFIGWTLSALAGAFIFLKDHLFHLGK